VLFVVGLYKGHLQVRSSAAKEGNVSSIHRPWWKKGSNLREWLSLPRKHGKAD
jgi:hypothetical protein